MTRTWNSSSEDATT